MQVFEEIGRKKANFKSDDWKATHNYIKNIINNRFEFNGIEENQFIFNEEKNEAAFDILITKDFDHYSKLEIELSVTLNTSSNKAEVDLIGTLKTEYPENTPFQKSIFYFFMRVVWERLYYGEIRKKYKGTSDQLMSELIKSILEISTE